jgi:hypothetical protein
MIIPIVTELTVIGVADPGIPNRERIVLRPTESLDLAQFGILIAVKNEDGSVIPIFDNFFWFGDLFIDPPCWINVYTGNGEFQKTILSDSNQPAYSLHWGRKVTVFNSPNIVPVLFRMDGILIGRQLANVNTKQING